MYKCLKCNKEFKYESKLNEHQNRKISCDSPKENLKCELCNVKFNRPVQVKFEDKIKEFIDYRNHETRLHNGYNPEIINSNIT
jgi:hypothetical protein